MAKAEDTIIRKVWVTKYALSGAGGFEVFENVRLCGGPDTTGGMIAVGGSRYFHGEGSEWHRTEKGARARVREMIKKKIASMRKVADKLTKLAIEYAE